MKVIIDAFFNHFGQKTFFKSVSLTLIGGIFKVAQAGVKTACV